MKSLNTTILKFGQKGFTLIELIITIVIIGVLAAVAIPKFQSLTADAEKGVAAGVGAALASASSVNYAKKLVPGAVAGTDYQTIAGCASFTAALIGLLADVPGGYTVTGTATGFNTAANLGTAQAGCSVTSTNGAVVAFSAYGA